MSITGQRLEAGGWRPVTLSGQDELRDEMEADGWRRAAGGLSRYSGQDELRDAREAGGWRRAAPSGRASRIDEG